MTISPHRENHLLAIPSTLGSGNFGKLKSLPGHFKWQGRNVVFRITGENIKHMLNHWPDSEWIGGCDSVRAKYLLQQERGEEIVKAKSDPAIIPDDSDYKYKRPPMDHQRKAFAISREATSFGLFMEQGTGKTKVTIDNACWLYQQELIDALIIVAWPNGVHRNWVEYELPADMSTPYVAEYWSSNYKAKFRQEAFAKLLEVKDKIRVMTFNVEAFVSQGAQDMILKMLARWRCMLVIDQSASIKNPQAKRTRFLIDKCSKLAKYRRVLDGAPVAEGADELYSQFKFLDPWIIGHDTWTGFKAEFCEIGYFNEIKGYKNLEELRRRIDGHCYRVLADDCLDLPERIYKEWPFDLSENERRVFDELNSQNLAYFGAPSGEKPTGKQLAATGKGLEIVEDDFECLDSGSLCSEGQETLEEHNALVKNLRLQQISSGWWPVDNVKPLDEDDHPSRLKALLTLLEAAEGKALIFARFRADLELIEKVLGKKAVSYHGGVSEEDRLIAKRKFMEDPKTLYFIGQPRSAGIGHTLTAAKHVIFYSNDPSLRLREECEKRAHRKGLKHKLMVWDLKARKTQDHKIITAFRWKKDLANLIMQDPENFFLRYEE
jgi:hypothetical protein